MLIYFYLARVNIITASYLVSSPTVDQCPKADKPEYAFIGRSNVGKSSLINMLCSQQQLAKTSATPGKTQLINHFLIQSETKKTGKSKQASRQNWYITDLPGYGYAKVSQGKRVAWKKMIENYLRKRTNLVIVFLLVDIRHHPQEIDLEFIRQLGAWAVPFSIVFTKSDKETQSVVQANIKKFTAALREDWESLPPFFLTSAVKHRGRKELLEFIENCNDSLMPQ